MSEASEIREWRMKWAEGVILGLAKGTLEQARAFGMLRTAKKKGIKDEELKAIIQAIETSPVYLSYMSHQDKINRLRVIREALKKGEI